MTCKFCGEQFGLKSESMKHRISNHNEKVPLCRENEKGTCKFNKECWYIHRNQKENQNNESNSENQTLKILKILETRFSSMENHIRIEMD